MAEQRSIKSHIENDQRSQNSIMEEHWHTIESEIMNHKNSNELELSRLNSKIGEASGTVLALNEEFTKLRNRLRENMDNTFSMIESNKKTNKIDLNDIKGKVEQI